MGRCYPHLRWYFFFWKHSLENESGNIKYEDLNHQVELTSPSTMLLGSAPMALVLVVFRIMILSSWSVAMLMEMYPGDHICLQLWSKRTEGCFPLLDQVKSGSPNRHEYQNMVGKFGWTKTWYKTEKSQNCDNDYEYYFISVHLYIQDLVIIKWHFRWYL